MSVIEVSNLTKKFKSLIAVNDVSFTVEEGCIFGLLGPNGAGKTTTIECIIGLKKWNQGNVRVLGINPLSDSKKLYDIIGVQLQETSYQDKIKVFELCELFMAMYEEPYNYLKLLDRFSLSDKKTNYVSDLSGGQKQKIAIILALIANPKIIFLDELTTGLDPKSRREMWAFIKDLKAEGKTVFLTTHYMEEAAYLCDKICIIDEGKIASMGSVDEIIEDACLYNIVSFETDDDITGLITNEIKGIDNITYDKGKVSIFSLMDDLISEVVILLKEKNIKYKKINISRPKLEDAFIKLTGKVWEG